ncbi:glutathione S-transferase 1-like [Arctopsyche grandis]|uniref:glutathione S-transferase 1-like n=1 Tax=Arctopsyche grandis TaxID=121162 RepID=UPI00406D7A33
MGISSSSKKKLDTSNTPVNDGRKKKANHPPPLQPLPENKAEEAEKTFERMAESPEKSPNVKKVDEGTPKLDESAIISETKVKVEDKNETNEDSSHAAAKVSGIKMPIDLYYLTPSAPCRAAMMTARIVGVELNLKVCNIMEGDHMKEDYGKMNPQRTIPTLNDNGFILWESRPIMAYFVNQYGKDDSLYPKNPKDRALVDQRLYFDMGSLYQGIVEYYFPMIFHSTPLNPEKLKALEKTVGILNTILDGRTFSAGDHLTIADISLAVSVSNLEAFEFDLAPYPNVKAWFLRTKDALAPFGYEEINQTGANMMGSFLKSKTG